MTTTTEEYVQPSSSVEEKDPPKAIQDLRGKVLFRLEDLEESSVSRRFLETKSSYGEESSRSSFKPPHSPIPKRRQHAPPAGKSLHHAPNAFARKNYGKVWTNDHHERVVDEVEGEGRENKLEEGKEEEKEGDDETETNDQNMYDLPNDAYAFIFLAPMGSQGFFFGLFVFVIKITLFSLLAIDALAAFKDMNHDETSKIVLATQCLILPVAVAMQDDLRSTYTLLSNVKYSSVVLDYHPHATKFKYYLANSLRGIDGMYSLCINFIVLLLARTVKGLFLNFAALEFLQNIDNMAFKYAMEGFMTPHLEHWACKVEEIRMPKRDNTNIVTNLDTVLFMSTLENLMVAWYMLKIY